MGDSAPDDREGAGGAMEGQEQEGPSGASAKHPALEHKLPLARVKRLIKAESDVTQLTAEAGALITKATELFLEKLATHAARHMVVDSRVTLRYKDVSTTVKEEDSLEFLRDIAPEPLSASQLAEGPENGEVDEESTDEDDDELAENEDDERT